MGLEAQHPLYTRFLTEWVTMRDLSAGEWQVKGKREVYLPATPSMILDGFGKGASKIGEQAYQGYLVRAQFPDYVSEGVEILVGMLNHKPAKFELPAVMEPLLKSCTLSGESLEDLLRQIHAEQLTTGRVGLLCDLPIDVPTPATPAPGATVTSAPLLPYIAMYAAESIINWDEAGVVDGLSALNLVVLNETTYKRDADFTWKEFKRYRVLQLGDLAELEAEGTVEYKVGVFDQDKGLQYAEGSMEPPLYRGASLKQVPFVFINTKD
jgi:hypothetical protein